jgi:YVTN family beta-propeller protein
MTRVRGKTVSAFNAASARRYCLFQATVALMAASSASAGVNTWTTNGPASTWIYALAIDRITTTTVYAGALGGHIYRTTDGGETWNPTAAAARHAFYALAIDPLTPATLFAGTDEDSDAVIKTDDRGAVWKPVYVGLPIQAVRALAIDPLESSIVYAGTEGSGLFKTTNGAAMWSQIQFPGTHVSTLAIDPQNPLTIYAATNGESDLGTFKSIDGGQTWMVMTLNGAGGFAVDPLAPQTVYAAWGHIFKSTDGGTTWDRMWQAQPGDGAGVLAIDPLTPTILYAGTETTVLKSTDAGVTWQPLDAGLPKTRVFALAIDPTSPTTLHAATERGVFDIKQISECGGDCADDGQVGADELLILVNIALGAAATTRCVVGDVDGSGDITIDEILLAVNNALLGCPPNSTPTPTPTATPTPTSHCVTALGGPWGLFDCNGGHGCLRVTAPDDCCWMASEKFDRVRFPSGNSGCGNADLCFELPPTSCYCTGYCATYEIEVGGLTWSVSQQHRTSTPRPDPTPSSTPTGATPTSTNTRLPTQSPIPTATGTPAVGLFAYAMDDRSIHVIDSASKRQVITLVPPTQGWTLTDLAVSRDGSRAYALTHGAIFVIDTRHNTFLPPLAIDAAGIAAVTGEVAYVTSGDDPGELDILDMSAGTVTSRIVVGALPRQVAVTADSSVAYVANFRSSSVSVVDLRTNQVINTIAFDSEPVTLKLTEDSSRLYVGTSQRGEAVIDTATQRVVQHLAIAGAFDVTPDNALVYLAVPEPTPHIAVLDARDGGLIRTISPYDPSWQYTSDIAITPDGTSAYVAVAASDFFGAILIIDTRTRALTATINGRAEGNAWASPPHIVFADIQAN